jgi:hypothetical protein
MTLNSAARSHHQQRDVRGVGLKALRLAKATSHKCMHPGLRDDSGTCRDLIWCETFREQEFLQLQDSYIYSVIVTSSTAAARGAR